MALNQGLFSSSTGEWETPQKLFDLLDQEFAFDLDPCATAENAKCERYFTKEDNGLLQEWDGKAIFVNPPYGRAIWRWVNKAWDESQGKQIVVMLIPSRTDTRWWHEWVMKANEIRFIRGRLYFGDGSKRAPFPSCVVIFDQWQGEPPMISTLDARKLRD